MWEARRNAAFAAKKLRDHELDSNGKPKHIIVFVTDVCVPVHLLPEAVESTVSIRLSPSISMYPLQFTTSFPTCSDFTIPFPTYYTMLLGKGLRHAFVTSLPYSRSCS